MFTQTTVSRSSVLEGDPIPDMVEDGSWLSMGSGVNWDPDGVVGGVAYSGLRVSANVGLGSYNEMGLSTGRIVTGPSDPLSPGDSWIEFDYLGSGIFDAGSGGGYFGGNRSGSRELFAYGGSGVSNGMIGENSSLLNTPVIDNTSEAWNHYMYGNGRAARLGENTINTLLYSEEFRLRHNRIVGGKTTLLTGKFSVDLTGDIFHIGRTNIYYSIICSGGECVVKYVLFADDGFWDVDFVDENILGRMGIRKFQPDGLGPNLERFGGTPYPYIPVFKEYKFNNPGY